MPPFYHFNNFYGKLPCRSQRGSELPGHVLLVSWTSESQQTSFLFSPLPIFLMYHYFWQHPLTWNLNPCLWKVSFWLISTLIYSPLTCMPNFSAVSEAKTLPPKKLSYGTSISNSSLSSILMPFPMFASFPWYPDQITCQQSPLANVCCFFWEKEFYPWAFPIWLLASSKIQSGFWTNKMHGMILHVAFPWLGILFLGPLVLLAKYIPSHFNVPQKRKLLATWAPVIKRSYLSFCAEKT